MTGLRFTGRRLTGLRLRARRLTGLSAGSTGLLLGALRRRSCSPTSPRSACRAGIPQLRCSGGRGCRARKRRDKNSHAPSPRGEEWLGLISKATSEIKNSFTEFTLSLIAGQLSCCCVVSCVQLGVNPIIIKKKKEPAKSRYNLILWF